MRITYADTNTRAAGLFTACRRGKPRSHGPLSGGVGIGVRVCHPVLLFNHYSRLRSSMSEVGQCWDNAPVESFFGRLKGELGVEVFDTRDQARAVLFEYLEVFYNRVRRHSALGFVSPAEFERAHSQTHR